MDPMIAEDVVSDVASLARPARNEPGGRTVRALINYLEDGACDSIWYASDSWRSHMPLRMETMQIEDVRPIRGRFSLDREGIFLADAPCSVTNFDADLCARAGRGGEGRHRRP